MSLGKYIILSIVMAVLWMLSMTIGMEVFGVDVEAQGNSENTVFLLFLASAINTGVIMSLITRSKWHGWKLVGSIALIIFGIQYFMSQMESLYFNEGLGMPIELIYAVIFGGVILSVTFSLVAVKTLGKWK